MRKANFVLCLYTKWLCGVFRDADDTKAWISEKDTALSTSDYGRDLASVQALQRKHEVLERDLAALEEKVCETVIKVLLVLALQRHAPSKGSEL